MRAELDTDITQPFTHGGANPAHRQNEGAVMMVEIELLQGLADHPTARRDPGFNQDLVAAGQLCVAQLGIR